MEAMTIATVVEGITTFFGGAISWMGDVVDFIGANALTMVMVVCVPLAGWGIGGVKRLFRL